MKKALRISVLGLVTAIAVGVSPLGFAQGTTMGASMGPNTIVMRLNLDKSTFQTPAPRWDRRVASIVNDDFKMTIRGEDGSGTRFMAVYNGKIDGKDYPVTGSPNVDSFSLTRSGPKSIAVQVKKNGKILVEGDSFTAADNRSWVLTLRILDEKGRKSPTTVEVYDVIDPVDGTWVLNLAKSSYQTPAPKGETRHVRIHGDTVDFLAIGTDEAGRPTRVSWQSRLDGKDYPVQGNASFDTIASTSSGPGAVSSVLKKKGKVVTTAERTISADGMTMQLVSNVILADGSTARNVAVFDLQH